MQLRWQQGDSKLGVASAPNDSMALAALLRLFCGWVQYGRRLLVVSPLLSSSPAPLARLAPALTHHCLYGNTSITRLLDGELDAASALSWHTICPSRPPSAGGPSAGRESPSDYLVLFAHFHQPYSRPRRPHRPSPCPAPPSDLVSALFLLVGYCRHHTPTGRASSLGLTSSSGLVQPSPGLNSCPATRPASQDGRLGTPVVSLSNRRGRFSDL
ncbi:hypothetical protein EDB83DRAFT_2555058 [Lactarius deliciosus]|nr:hypothetical protein EDB83DRAFT_2555058 [Lactarius deliciosus]